MSSLIKKSKIKATSQPLRRDQNWEMCQDCSIFVAWILTYSTSINTLLATICDLFVQRGEYKQENNFLIVSLVYKGCNYCTNPHWRGIFIFNVRKCYTIIEKKNECLSLLIYNYKFQTSRMLLTINSWKHYTLYMYMNTLL